MAGKAWMVAPVRGIAEIPEGGISLERLATLGNDAAWIQLGGQDQPKGTPGASMKRQFSMDGVELPMPIGISATDAWVEQLLTLGNGQLGEQRPGPVAAPSISWQMRTKP